jgi:NAD-dependent DNA ligase
VTVLTYCPNCQTALHADYGDTDVTCPNGGCSVNTFDGVAQSKD